MAKETTKKPVNSRNKGHQFERRIKNQFKKIGYENCITTRQGSRYLDAKKQDLMNIPFIVQCKNVAKNINYTDLYEEIKSERVNDDPIVIFHKKDNGKNTSFAVIEESEFFKLLAKYDKNNKIPFTAI